MSVALPFLVDLALKGGLLCLAGAAAAVLAHRRSAALRHDIWLVVLACCGLLPLAAAGGQAVGALPVLDPIRVVAANGGGGAAGRLIRQVWIGADGGAHAWLAAAIVAGWLSGVALVITRTLAAHFAAAALARRGQAANLPHAPAGVPVRLIAELSSPAVFGVVRSVILMPAASPQWPGARLAAVFAHEKAHVARRDGALELVVRLACAVHWFNPLVWMAARRLRSERELACDERVLAQGLEPRAYAQELLQVAHEALTGRPAPSALIAMAQPPELERRIRVLLAVAPPRGDARVRAAAALASVALFVPLAALTAPSAAGPGSVQPGSGRLLGLDDPLSERIPLDYAALARRAAHVPASGPDAAAIATLHQELGRTPEGYGDLVRERAIWTLSQADGGRLFEPLAARVGDRDWRVRAYAAWGLAAVGDWRATPLLEPLLRDRVWRVRAMAAAALAELGDPRAAEAMAAASRDPAWQVRISVVEYAGRIGDPALKSRLRPLLGDPHWGTRTRAAWILTRS